MARHDRSLCLDVNGLLNQLNERRSFGAHILMQSRSRFKVHHAAVYIAMTSVHCFSNFFMIFLICECLLPLCRFTVSPFDRHCAVLFRKLCTFAVILELVKRLPIPPSLKVTLCTATPLQSIRRLSSVHSGTVLELFSTFFHINTVNLPAAD